MSNKKIVISRDVTVDEFRQFDSRKSAISVQEIDLPQDEIDFMQENQHSGAAGTGSGEVEIDLPQGEIDFMQENLNSQPAEGTVQQPFVTETGESSRRPTRQRGLPQRLLFFLYSDLPPSAQATRLIHIPEYVILEGVTVDIDLREVVEGFFFDKDIMRSRSLAAASLVLEKKKKKLAENWTSTWHGDDDLAVYGVTIDKVVNFKQEMCACRKWDLFGIPGSHAITCIWLNKKESKEYVSECSRQEKEKRRMGISLPHTIGTFEESKFISIHAYGKESIFKNHMNPLVEFVVETKESKSLKKERPNSKYQRLWKC
ncbi:hypothetical protein KIW84_074339 [Lathyrus oleraceus]|uniref:Uncharacterized protein n=1 Tax=Pisum sativum TaxID=3888 RepID=A0A9D4VSI7_PEA|nr:hypothetical protein KIW84_074339 [Pisum sativum]